MPSQLQTADSLLHARRSSGGLPWLTAFALFAAAGAFAQRPGQWGQRAPLLAPNSETAVGELDGKIYVIGGYPKGRLTVDTVQVYDTAKDQWKLTTPLPVPLNHSMAASVNGKLYVIGGQTSAQGEESYVNTVYEYDPVAERWAARAPMPTERSAGGAAVIDGKIYVPGGRPPHGSNFAVYDPKTNAWTRLPDLPTQRNHLAAVAINGKLYVAGGRFGGGFQSDVTDHLEIYDPATNQWSAGAPMPVARGGINGVVANGCFHIWGGEGNKNDPSGLFIGHDVYNPFNNTWKSLDPMPIAVHGVTGSAFLNGLIYLPGGGTEQGGNSGSTLHQVYHPELSCR